MKDRTLLTLSDLSTFIDSMQAEHSHVAEGISLPERVPPHRSVEGQTDAENSTHTRG